MLKFAIIGSGYIAQNHVGAIKQIPDCELVAVISNDEPAGKATAERAGCRYYETLDEALDREQIDIVNVCVPTFLHERFVVEAANAKCHVLCEKPVTFTLDSFNRMVDACEKNGVRFMVGQVGRFWPEFAEIRRLLSKDKLGPIHMVYEKRLCQHPTWTTWHKDPSKSGGGLYDLNIHDIDFLVSCFGRPARLYANGWCSDTGCWNHICTSLTWPSGLQAMCETSTEMTGAWPFSIEFRGVGDAGTLCYELTAGVNINDGERGSNLRWYPVGGEPQPIEAQQTDMFVAEISEFFSAIKEDRPAYVTPEQSRQVLEVILATKRSLESGEVVDL